MIVAANGWVASTTASTFESASHRRSPSDTTEPADADIADRQRGIGHPPRQRADHVDGGMQSRGEQSRLCGAAEEQHTHQWCSRRTLPDEYR